MEHINLPSFTDVQGFKGSGVPRLKTGSSIRLHSRPRTAFAMHIYEKIVSFVSPNPKLGAKLAIIWENEHFQPGLQDLNAFFVLNLER